MVFLRESLPKDITFTINRALFMEVALYVIYFKWCILSLHDHLCHYAHDMLTSIRCSDYVAKNGKRLLPTLHMPPRS